MTQQHLESNSRTRSLSPAGVSSSGRVSAQHNTHSCALVLKLLLKRHIWSRAATNCARREHCISCISGGRQARSSRQPMAERTKNKKARKSRRISLWKCPSSESLGKEKHTKGTVEELDSLEEWLLDECRQSRPTRGRSLLSRNLGIVCYVVEAEVQLW